MSVAQRTQGVLDHGADCTGANEVSIRRTQRPNRPACAYTSWRGARSGDFRCPAMVGPLIEEEELRVRERDESCSDKRLGEAETRRLCA